MTLFQPNLYWTETWCFCLSSAHQDHILVCWTGYFFAAEIYWRCFLWFWVWLVESCKYCWLIWGVWTLLMLFFLCSDTKELVVFPLGIEWSFWISYGADSVNKAPWKNLPSKVLHLGIVLSSADSISIINVNISTVNIGNTGQFYKGQYQYLKTWWNIADIY